MPFARWMVAGLFAIAALRGQPLPGTQPLDGATGMLPVMLGGIDRFLTRQTEGSVTSRERHWRRDFSSPAAYERSVSSNREHFRKIIGLVDERPVFEGIEYLASTARSSLLGSGAGYQVHAVRWPALDGVDAEGLLLEPAGPPRAQIVVLPDADWTPEMIAGLAPGVPPRRQLARRLAENGNRVLVPTLVDRANTWSGKPEVRLSNQPHREFLHRPRRKASR